MQAWVLWNANTGNFCKPTLCHLGETICTNKQTMQKHTYLSNRLELANFPTLFSTTDLNITQLFATSEENTSIWLLCTKLQSLIWHFTSFVTISARDLEVSSKCTNLFFIKCAFRLQSHVWMFSEGIFCFSLSLTDTHVRTSVAIVCIPKVVTLTSTTNCQIQTLNEAQL